MKRIHIVLALLGYLVIDCSNENKVNETQDIYTLIKQSKVTFPIDSVTTSTGEFQYYQDKHLGKEYFVLLNDNLMSLQFYDFKTQQLLKKIDLSKASSPSFGKVTSFGIVSLDSIYLVSSYHFQITQINFKGDIIRQYYMLNDDIYFNKETLAPPHATAENFCSMPYPGNENPLVKINGQLFLKGIPLMSAFSNEMYSDGKLMISLNLLTGGLNYFMNYPEIYIKNHQYFPIQFKNESYCYNEHKNVFVYSFPPDNYVYCIDTEGKEVAKYWAGSNLFSEVELMNSATKSYDDYDIIKHGEHAYNTDRYCKMYYDSYRKFYYRLVWHPNPKHLYSATNKETKFKMNVSVVILNSDLQKVGETLLDESVWNSYMFSTDAGIYMQSDSKSEDAIEFTLLKLEEK